MTRVVVFYLLLLSVAVLAFRRGDGETRAAVLVALAATLASATSVQLFGAGEPVEFMVAGVDLAVLASFVAIALRSPRFWPLWAAGLQLTTVLAHLLRIANPELVNFAYQAAMRFWSYPILLIIAIAALRTPPVAMRGQPAA